MIKCQSKIYFRCRKACATWSDRRMLEEVSTERAGGIVGGGEPFVQAGRVELLLASPAKYKNNCKNERNKAKKYR
jgi:hypothetical protein